MLCSRRVALVVQVAAVKEIDVPIVQYCGVATTGAMNVGMVGMRCHLAAPEWWPRMVCFRVRLGDPARRDIGRDHARHQRF